MWKFPIGSIVEHIATKQTYTVFAYAKLEGYDAEAYVYGGHDKTTWVRAKKDFEDGRFRLFYKTKLPEGTSVVFPKSAGVLDLDLLADEPRVSAQLSITDVVLDLITPDGSEELSRPVASSTSEPEPLAQESAEPEPRFRGPMPARKSPVGQALRKQRALLDITQDQVAAVLNISRNQVSKAERGLYPASSPLVKSMMALYANARVRGAPTEKS